MIDDEVVHQNAVKGRHGRVAPNMVYLPGSRMIFGGGASSHPHCIIPHGIDSYFINPHVSL